MYYFNICHNYMRPNSFTIHLCSSYCYWYYHYYNYYCDYQIYFCFYLFLYLFIYFCFYLFLYLFIYLFSLLLFVWSGDLFGEEGVLLVGFLTLGCCELKELRGTQPCIYNPSIQPSLKCLVINGMVNSCYGPYCL